MKRIVGRSGIEVSALGMGCWAIGGPYWNGGNAVGWGEVGVEEGIRGIYKGPDLGGNLFYTANGDGTGPCEKENLAALNRGPLAMGLLTNKYTVEVKIPADDVRGEKSPEWMKYFRGGKPNQEWVAKRDAVREILTSNGRTIAQGALAWLWARSEKTLPIPGF